MPHTYIPSGIRNSTITVPDDGDAATGFSIQVPTEALAEEAELIGRLVPGGSALVASEFKLPLIPFRNDNTRFVSSGLVLSQNDVSDGGGVVIPVPFVPLNATITAAFLYLKGAGAHVGLPGTMPQLSLRRIDRSSFVTTTIGTQADTSGTTGVYQVVHTIQLTVSEVAVSSDYLYYLQFSGETGANALTGLAIGSLSLTIVGA